MRLDSNKYLKMSMFQESYEDYTDEYSDYQPKYYKVLAVTEPLDPSKVILYTRWYRNNKGSR